MFILLVLGYIYKICVMSLRKKRSETLRAQMLASAEALIRSTEGTDFSMKSLASAAEVSPTTPYNFFGTKEGLLFELLTIHMADFMDAAATRHSSDAVEQVLISGQKAVQLFLGDPVLMRPLYHVVFGVTDPLHHPKFLASAFRFYYQTLDQMNERKLFESNRHRIILASSLMAHFMGVLDLWIHEDVDDTWFSSQISYGFAHMLWPLAKGKSLKILKKNLSDSQENLYQTSFVPLYIKPMLGEG